MNDSSPSNLPMEIRAAYLMMHRQAEIVLRPGGVTANQFVILWALSRQDTTQSELVKIASSDRNTIRPVLLGLERKRWIRRSPHPTDGRALIVKLTPAGRRKFEQVERVGAEFREQLERQFRPKELVQFCSFLERVQSHFNV